MQAPHVVMNEISNPELNEIVVNMDREDTHSEEAIRCLLTFLEDYVTPNQYSKLEETLPELEV